MPKGRVTFNEAACKGCELCVHACPKKILRLDGQRVNANGYKVATIFNPDECIACGLCALFCPDTVISVERIQQ